MSNIVSLQAVREQRERQKEQQERRQHAEALVLFECAALLARKQHPELIAVVEKAFGPGFLAKRTDQVCEPIRRDDAPAKIVKSRRR